MPLAFATSVVVARELGPSYKGTYDLAVASAGLLALVLGLALPAGITFSVARGLASPRRVAGIVLVAAVVQLVVAYGLLSLGQGTSVGASVLPTVQSPEMQALVALLAAGTGAVASMKAILMGRQLIARGSWIDLGGRVLLLGGLVGVGLALAGTRPSPELIVGIAATASLVTAVVLGLAAVHRTVPGGPLGLAQGIRVALPSYAANVLQFLNYRLDLFLVALFRTSAEVGLYALAATIAQLIWLISNAMAAALFPRVAANDEGVGPVVARTARFSRFALASAAVQAVLLGIVAAPLLQVVYGSAFEPAAVPIWLLLPGVVMFAPVNVLAAHLAGLARTELNLVVSAASLVVTVTLDLVLIPKWGMTGAALATSVAYGTSALLTVVLYCRVVRSPPADLLVPTPDDLRAAADRIRAVVWR